LDGASANSGTGKFDGLFIEDVLGVYDVYQGTAEHAIRQAAQIPSVSTLPVTALKAETESLPC
jgi:long-chain alkane monooxygenase